MSRKITRPETTGMRIALALGGGGARGWAYIGVLRCLQEYGIEPDIICRISHWCLLFHPDMTLPLTAHRCSGRTG